LSFQDLGVFKVKNNPELQLQLISWIPCSKVLCQYIGNVLSVNDVIKVSNIGF